MYLMKSPRNAEIQNHPSETARTARCCSRPHTDEVSQSEGSRKWKEEGRQSYPCSKVDIIHYTLSKFQLCAEYLSYSLFPFA